MAGAAEGHLDGIEALIGTLGVDVDAGNMHGKTAPMIAAKKNGHTDTASALRRYSGHPRRPEASARGVITQVTRTRSIAS